MEWTRGPTIGRGSSAAVSLASCGRDGRLVAVKSTDLSSSALLRKEESLISHLCSPYIVKWLGSDITRENGKHVFNLFLEYVPGGTLSDLIRSRGGRLEESAIRFYARLLLLGLNYLHRKGIVHCDVKGENVLIGEDGLRISDFGCAKCLESGDSAAIISGTPAYMAPEVARGKEQGFAADVWAVGCTVIEMATGANPWPEMKDPASALYRIAFSGDVPEFPEWLSCEAKDFLSKCLIRDFKERWTAGELLQHPFFDSVEENCGGIARKSPTSVMDGGFWNDVEASESSRYPSEIGNSSVEYPAGRIRDLIADDFPVELNYTEWTEEEDWLTVRDNGDLMAAESVMLLGVGDDVVLTSVMTEDRLNGEGAFAVMIGENNLYLEKQLLINKTNSLPITNFAFN